MRAWSQRQTGHVACHEAGAIEYSGHKVITVPQYEGKMKAEDLKNCLKTFWDDESHEHMVFPGMVYISHPTEYGTLYTKAELEEISGVCRSYNIPLFLDGARLGYGLMSEETDVTLPMIAKILRCFLYRRDKSRSTVWRSRRIFGQQNTETFPDADQTAGSTACKRQIARNPV